MRLLSLLYQQRMLDQHKAGPSLIWKSLKIVSKGCVACAPPWRASRGQAGSDASWQEPSKRDFRERPPAAHGDQAEHKE